MLKVCLLLLLCGCSSSIKLQCLDENQNPVDWLYMYKLPKHVSSNGDGLEYMYLHENSGGWQKSIYPIDGTQSIPGTLISQLTSEDLVIMYNDEPPEEKSDEARGHTKGVVAGNADGGFWLVHSVPKFPASDFTKYSYPPTGHLYGQSFLCITINGSSALDSVGGLISYNEPHVYVGQVPVNLQSAYPDLSKVARDKQWVEDPPFYKKNMVGNFTVFSKSHKFNKELYVDWVAPTLGTDLLVESWLHGPGVISTDCEKPFRVYNVEDISLPTGKRFKSMEDHSKWGVGKTHDWICVGDINRAEHQKKRGGGTVCRLDSYVAGAFRRLVESLYPCPKNNSL